MERLASPVARVESSLFHKPPLLSWFLPLCPTGLSPRAFFWPALPSRTASGDPFFFYRLFRTTPRAMAHPGLPPLTRLFAFLVWARTVPPMLVFSREHSPFLPAMAWLTLPVLPTLFAVDRRSMTDGILYTIISSFFFFREGGVKGPPTCRKSNS